MLKRTAATYYLCFKSIIYYYNDVIELGRPEREFCSTDRTKFDRIIFKSGNKSIILGLVGSSGGISNRTSSLKNTKDIEKLHSNMIKAMKNSKADKMFCVRYYEKKVCGSSSLSLIRPSPASQPSQRPPTPTQQQPARPMGYRPPLPPGAPSGYRPPIPRPGLSSHNGSSYPGLPANPRPGFIPQQQRPLMRPAAQSPTMSPAARPAVVGSPIVSPAAVQQEALVSPQIQHAEHHKKKRMYPEQIAKAYSGDAPVSPAYSQQQQPYASPSLANTQPQFISPMGTPSYVQPQLQQQQQQQQAPQQTYAQPQASNVGYNSYGQILSAR
ncbi:unnamed protein product [Rhizopus stolonifer]